MIRQCQMTHQVSETSSSSVNLTSATTKMFLKKLRVAIVLLNFFVEILFFHGGFQRRGQE